MIRPRLLAGLLLTAAVGAPAGARPVEIEIPLPARLPLRPNATLGFLAFRDEGAYTWVHPGKELENALRRDLVRSPSLRVLAAPAAPLPEQDFSEIVKNVPYLRRIGEKLGADYLITGEVRYTVRDTSGYYPYERTLPDGSTEQVTRYQEMKEYKLVYDFYLFDGHSGELVHQDRFTALRNLPQGATEDLAGFYGAYERIRLDLTSLLSPVKRTEVRYLYR